MNPGDKPSSMIQQGQAANTKAAEVTNDMAEAARSALDDATKALQKATDQLKEQATKAADLAIGYTKDEPFKALLIAAATGAALMGLLGLMLRSDE